MARLAALLGDSIPVGDAGRSRQFRSSSLATCLTLMGVTVRETQSGAALFLAVFAIANVCGDLVRPGFSAGTWWLDLRPLPGWSLRAWELASGLALLTSVFALGSKQMRTAVQGVLLATLAVAGCDSEPVRCILCFLGIEPHIQKCDSPHGSRPGKSGGSSNGPSGGSTGLVGCGSVMIEATRSWMSGRPCPRP